MSATANQTLGEKRQDVGPTSPGEDCLEPLILVAVPLRGGSARRGVECRCERTATSTSNCRRDTLSHLTCDREQATLGDLSEQIGVRENGIEIEKLPPHQRKYTHTSLQQIPHTGESRRSPWGRSSGDPLEAVRHGIRCGDPRAARNSHPRCCTAGCSVGSWPGRICDSGVPRRRCLSDYISQRRTGLESEESIEANT